MKKSKLRFSVGLVLVLVMGLSLFSMSVAASGRLIVAMPAEPNKLDPHTENDVYSHWVNDHIYEKLTVLSEEMVIIPGLAESWEWKDDVTLVMYLRKGVKFHNGEDFTAEDVKYSLQRHQSPETVSPNFARLEAIDVDNIEVIDTHTIKIPLRKPSAAILNDFAYSGSAIVNKKAVEQYGADYGRNPVGTGPFKFKQWRSGDYVLLERNEDYWGELAGSKEIQFRPIPADANRSIEIETGGAHIAIDISANDVKRIESHKDLTLARELGTVTTYYFFNTHKKPFDDIRVRQAIRYALDVEAMVEAIFEGVGAPGYSPINPSLLDVEGSNVQRYEYNVEKAKQLLKEAGYENGFKFTVTVGNQQPRIDLTEIMQALLAPLNIDVDINITEFAALMDISGKGEHEVVILGWNCSTGDLNQGAMPLFHSSQHGSAGNRSFYTNARVDELFDMAAVEIDSAERRASYYVEINEILSEELPVLAVHYGENVVGYRHDDIENLVLHPSGRHMLWKVRMK